MQETENQAEINGAERVYELGYLVVPTESPDDVPAIYGNLKELITSNGGNVISDEMPRMMGLAYTMEKVYKNVRTKYDQAYFGWVKFTAESDKLAALKKALDLDPKLIRYLIIKTVKENTIAGRRFMHREGMPHRRPMVTKREEGTGEPAPEINKEEIDKEIDALVA